MNKKIIIIGAGPTGLGAGYRLKELGYTNFQIFEKNSYAGGLSASFTDKNFTYDIGGHVIFSHYPYFDQIVDKFLDNKYQINNRNASIWIQNRFIPYPFQNNIQFLEKDAIKECLFGLIDVQGEKNLKLAKKAKNFQEWVTAVFGKGIAKYFMNPYNFKVWAHPLHLLSKKWISERVSVIDIKKILENYIFMNNDSAWGPNNVFKYPLNGGTGGLFTNFANSIHNHINYNTEITGINLETKTIEINNQQKEHYELIINTSPLDLLIKKCAPKNNYLINETKKLLHNGVLTVGIGLKKKIITDRSWVYFPEDNTPFYRLTYLSNYSPNMMPNNDYTNLLLEVSYSKFKKEDKNKAIEEVIKGLINTKIIESADVEKIKSKVLFDANYAYPIPSIKRDQALEKILPFLEQNQIYSRGRFGLWKYEAGNMDHSVMQGVEIVDFLLNNKTETTIHFK